MKKKQCKVCEVVKASLAIILLLTLITFFSVLLVGVLDTVFGGKLDKITHCENVSNIDISKEGNYYVGSFEYREPSGKGGYVIL